MTEKTAQVSADADNASKEIDQAQQIWNELEAEDFEGAASPEDEPLISAQDPPDAGQGQDEPKTKPTAGKPEEDLAAQNERLRHSIESDKGRISALTKKTAYLQAKLDRLESTKREIQTTATTPETKQGLAKVKDEYSDFSPLVEMAEANDKVLSQIVANADADIEDTKGQLKELIDQQNQIFMNEHPDGLKVIADNAAVFREWIQDQPRQIRDAFKRNEVDIVDGQSAALVVASFKESLQLAATGNAPAPNSTSTLQARREKQLAGAQSQRSTAATITTPAPGPGDDAAAHWNYFERLDQEKRNRR
jgi:hypothetical protein